MIIIHHKWSFKLLL